MKKLAFATAIAAAVTISTGAHAQVSSNITAIELDVSGVPSQIDCATLPNSGFVTGLALSGTGIGAINWTGQVCLDISGGAPYVALVFSLHDGQSATSPNGTLFNQGHIDVYTDFGTGWIYATTVDATVNNIACLDNSPTPGTAVGLVWAGTPGTTALPGAPTATNAVCDTTLFGLPSKIYLTGSKTE